MPKQENGQLTALRAAQRFLGLHPEFFPCPENREALNSWFRSHGESPRDADAYERAFEDLTAQHQLLLNDLEASDLQMLTPQAYRRHMIKTGEWEQAHLATTKAERVRDFKAEQKAKELAMMTADEAKRYYESRGEWPERGVR